MRFNGSDYKPEIDNYRLGHQLSVIYNIMIDGKWRTLKELREITGFSEASISAQLRHLRKERFGRHKVERERMLPREHGLFKYRVLKPFINTTQDEFMFVGKLGTQKIGVES